jgi:hypothetical protein
MLIPMTSTLNKVRSFLPVIRSHWSLSKWRVLTLVWTRRRPTLQLLLLQQLLPTPLSRNAVTMRNANPRATSSP